MTAFGDFVRAPNQAGYPALYDVENAAIDPDGGLAAALDELAPVAGRDVVDLGCGSGWWLPGYAAAGAATVTGVEPDPDLLALARRRTEDVRVRVRAGSAEHIPLPDASVDVVHARFAYFFPPGCDAGLTEALRVLRPGGTLVVVDNDHRWGEFAQLLAASAWSTLQGRAETTDAWWAARGARRREVRSAWRFRSAADCESVLRLEFPTAVVDEWLGHHPGATGLSYGYVLFGVTKPDRARR